MLCYVISADLPFSECLGLAPPESDSNGVPVKACESKEAT